MSPVDRAHEAMGLVEELWTAMQREKPAQFPNEKASGFYGQIRPKLAKYQHGTFITAGQLVYLRGIYDKMMKGRRR